MASKDGESKGSAKSKVLMVGVAVVGVAGLLKGFVLGGGASARVAATGGDAVTTTTARSPKGPEERKTGGSPLAAHSDSLLCLTA